MGENEYYNYLKLEIDLNRNIVQMKNVNNKISNCACFHTFILIFHAEIFQDFCQC